MPDVFVSEPENLIEDEGFKGGGYHRLSSFIFYPDHVDFETREKEEKVVLLLRQHPIVNLKWILIAVLFLFVPSVVKYFGVLESLPVGFELVIMLAWYLVTMAYALENFLSWYFNVYFVTNKRVIDVDFYNLIDKKVSDASIDKIQDVSYTSFGVPRMLFNYGNVTIQTAAEISEFEFEAVPNPEKVVKIIDDLKPEGGKSGI